MKILFLHSLADPKLGGGAEETLWTLMRGLRDEGHACVLLATSDEPGLHRTDREGIRVWNAGIRNLYWPFHKIRPAAPLRMLWHLLDSYNPWMQGYLRQVVAEEKPHVVSLHCLPGWSAAVWRTLARLGMPAIQVLHDYYAICIKSSCFKGGSNCVGQCVGCHALRLPHRALSRHVPAVVGVSNYVLQRHRSLGYFEGVAIQRVIHNARSPDHLGITQQSVRASHTGFRFGYIGRLDPAKGVELLIEAFRSADLPGSELWIAGSGKQNYEAQLHGNMLDPRVRFLGRLTPKEFYPQVDVVVVPSLWNDNLPGVVFESLAFGKPVIGSRRGGIPEMIHDGNNGLLFEPDNLGELVDCMRRVHDDINFSDHLARNTRPSSVPFIDIPLWVSAYEAIYTELLTAFIRKKSHY